MGSGPTLDSEKQLSSVAHLRSSDGIALLCWFDRHMSLVCQWTWMRGLILLWLMADALVAADAKEVAVGVNRYTLLPLLIRFGHT